MTAMIATAPLVMMIATMNVILAGVTTVIGETEAAIEVATETGRRQAVMKTIVGADLDMKTIDVETIVGTVAAVAEGTMTLVRGVHVAMIAVAMAGVGGIAEEVVGVIGMGMLICPKRDHPLLKVRFLSLRGNAKPPDGMWLRLDMNSTQPYRLNKLVGHRDSAHSCDIFH